MATNKSNNSIIQFKGQYSRTGRIGNINGENCLSNAQCVHQEYVRHDELVVQDHDQGYVQQDDYVDYNEEKSGKATGGAILPL
jgi:hypothetical protein